MSSSIRRLNAMDTNITTLLNTWHAWGAHQAAALQGTVRRIIRRVRAEGDSAVLAYTRRFDRLKAASLSDLAVSREALAEAHEALAETERTALEFAAQRIRAYHEQQRTPVLDYEDEYGNRLSQRVTPIDKVGLYVPGGQASYPSSVLMAAIPAMVAGVGELVMTVPAPGGQLNPLVLAAAHLAGVHRVFRIGGAQAVAALAFGTETVPRVHKIVGPGGSYVAEAKRQVFGVVGIDMLAGPSEILVVADAGADPEKLALDLFAQAEHDVNARALLLSPDAALLDAVAATMERLLPTQAREAVIRRSLEEWGGVIKVSSLEQAIDLVNRIAPEHLELAVADPAALLPEIRNAGCIFLGYRTSEVFGDYVAGPSHVLPTFGTARFSSPLGVYDFEKRSSVIACSSPGAETLGRFAAVLAQAEGLEAHAASARWHLAQDDGEGRGANERNQPALTPGVMPPDQRADNTLSRATEVSQGSTLEGELEAFVSEMLSRANQQGYRLQALQEKLAQQGTVAAIEQLVCDESTGEPQSGLNRLWAIGLLDWSLEAAVLEFSDLFSKEVQEAAKKRLDQKGNQGPETVTGS